MHIFKLSTIFLFVLKSFTKRLHFYAHRMVNAKLVNEVFGKLSYGPNPEASALVDAWIEAHNGMFFAQEAFCTGNTILPFVLLPIMSL